MNVSELIIKLKELKEIHGDVEVKVADGREFDDEGDDRGWTYCSIEGVSYQSMFWNPSFIGIR